MVGVYNIETLIIELEKSLLTYEVRHSEAELRKRIAPNFREIGAIDTIGPVSTLKLFFSATTVDSLTHVRRY